MKTGIELIAQERQEQIEKHGRTIELDAEINSNGELSDASDLLCAASANPPEGWDDEIWKKMVCKPYKERLIIAGALIAAEIDRINYIENNEL